jgi:hypothetical protein
MSQQSQFATTKRGGKDPLTPIAAKNMIKDTNKGNVAVFAQLLDIKPDFYESRIATVIRQGLREVDSEPLTGQVGKDELYEKPLRKEGILCNIGERPSFWQYSADDMIRKTVHIRRQIRNEQPELFSWDRLESTITNDEFLEIYLPNYWELECILESMQKHERRKLLDQPKLRTAAGDLSATPRYGSGQLASPSPSRTLGRMSPTKSTTATTAVKKLARSSLAIAVLGAKEHEYRTIPFTDFYSENALQDWQHAGGKGDLSAELFSVTKLKSALSRYSAFDLEKGYLRLKVTPPQEDFPEYFNLNGVEDRFGNDQEKLQEIIEQFKHDAQVLKKDTFKVDYVQHEVSRKRQRTMG